MRREARKELTGTAFSDQISILISLREDAAMELRYLGRSGIRVSALTLGAMSFGSMGHAAADDCARIVHRALDAGINVVDTADVYSGGESERIVGAAIKDRRD